MKYASHWVWRCPWCKKYACIEYVGAVKTPRQGDKVFRQSMADHKGFSPLCKTEKLEISRID